MSEQFYLQDNRGNVGANLMWWAKDGKGYTSDLDRAELYTREAAQAQHDCRGSDIPWPAAYIDLHAQFAVDTQYLSAAADSDSQTASCFLQRKGRFVGNDALWLTTDGSDSTDPALAMRVGPGWSDRLMLSSEDFTPWSCAYINTLIRRVAVASRSNLAEALVGTGIVLRKPEKPRRTVYSCHGCGRFLSESQIWSGSCPHCAADNRP